MSLPHSWAISLSLEAVLQVLPPSFKELLPPLFGELLPPHLGELSVYNSRFHISQPKNPPSSAHGKLGGFTRQDDDDVRIYIYTKYLAT